MCFEKLNIFALPFKIFTIPVQIFAIPLARDWSEELGKAGAGKVKLHWISDQTAIYITGHISCLAKQTNEFHFGLLIKKKENHRALLNAGANECKGKQMQERTLEREHKRTLRYALNFFTGLFGHFCQTTPPPLF